MSKQKENEEEFKPRKPDYKGNGIDIWVSKDHKDKSKTVLLVKVLYGKTIVCFENNGAEKND